MVLGTSDVRLIDMTRAFAGVSAKGVAVAPYGILKVATAEGEVLYTRPASRRKCWLRPKWPRGSSICCRPR